MEEGNIAVYLDFENLALSAEEIYPSQKKPLGLNPIIDYLASKGNICLRKAYANWSNPAFSFYQRDLIEAGFEMIHLPGTTAKGKTGADVRLAIDAIEMLELFNSIDTYVIGSGDSDFIPLIQRLRARGKKVIVIGFEHSVGTLVKRNCTEYKSLEEILGEQEREAISINIGHETEIENTRKLMVRYLNTISPEGPVAMAKLKQDLLRLDSSFSEKRIGFKTFKDFIKSFEGDIVERIESDPTTKLPRVLFNEITPLKIRDKSTVEKAIQFLKMNLKFPSVLSDIDKMSSTLLKILSNNEYLSMKEMSVRINKELKGISKISIRKFINTLFTNHAFKGELSSSYIPLASRKFNLKDSIKNPDAIKEIYLDRVVEILNNRFPELGDEDIKNIIYSR